MNSTAAAVPPSPLTLSIFAISTLCMLVLSVFPVRYLAFWLPPVLGCIILLLAQAVPPSTIYQGAFLGDSRIQPFAILIIFYSLAYVCLSLDASGALALFSQTLINQCRNSSLRLFLIVAALSTCLTLATSNDVVILTLTPLVIHATRLAGVSPVPFLLMQFTLANILSAVLIIGNPTNVVVGVAMNLSFSRFFVLMVVPALISALVALVLSLVVSRADLRLTLVTPSLDPHSLLRDPTGAILQGLVLAVTLALFPAITLTVANAQLWQVALASGLASLSIDLARLPLVRSSAFKYTPLRPDSAPPSLSYIQRVSLARAKRISPSDPDKAPAVWTILGGMPIGLFPFVRLVPSRTLTDASLFR